MIGYARRISSWRKAGMTALLILLCLLRIDQRLAMVAKTDYALTLPPGSGVPLVLRHS
jgi:hypothetical protein